MGDQADGQPEKLLANWLVESDHAQERETLNRLIIEHAVPVVRRIVSYKLMANADVDDVCNEALRSLLAHLAAIKVGTQQTLPKNFNNYVAVTAFNACNEYFRDRSPARHRLANKLRYLLTHSSDFALWESKDGRDIAGSVSMRGREPKGTVSISQFADIQPGQGLIDTVLALFQTAKAPLTFEDLLEIVAHSTGLTETETKSEETSHDASRSLRENIPDSTPGIEDGLMEKQHLSRLWEEICELPIQQRSALLLNLKDSAGGDIQLFNWLGIATIEQIGKVLEMTPERFAVLWKELPLEDSRIALELGIQRQDVINRRSSARKRLANRMKEY